MKLPATLNTEALTKVGNVGLPPSAAEGGQVLSYLRPVPGQMWIQRRHGYRRRITDQTQRLQLKCTNCGVVFPSEVELSPQQLEEATIQDRTYKCPVCANFDTYGKADLFYESDG